MPLNESQAAARPDVIPERHCRPRVIGRLVELVAIGLLTEIIYNHVHRRVSARLQYAERDHHLRFGEANQSQTVAVRRLFWRNLPVVLSVLEGTAAGTGPRRRRPGPGDSEGVGASVRCAVRIHAGVAVSDHGETICFATS